ncbi:MAG: glutamine-hydrolyzing carbamoyl-phosphate synthase small subunit [Candidatus Makana argininalis]
MINSSLLILEDGTEFKGCSIGIKGTTTGEVVFNTSMTGYQEIITDPSYSNQIITFTYPHIGNTGINKLDNESSKIHISGIIIKDISFISSHFRSNYTLSYYLKKNNIVGIGNIDTRRLTRIIRNKGTQHGCIISDYNNKKLYNIKKNKKNYFINKKIDVVKKVSTNTKYIWIKNSYVFNYHCKNKLINFIYHIVVYDYGIKHNILCMLVDRGCLLTVVPSKTSAEEIIKMKPDGVFLSNGPGDPLCCFYSISYINKFIKNNIPIFGICLGHQLLALSHGAKIIKMKYGHHGGNHPVKDLKTNKIMITTQNHGFTVNNNNIPKTLKITHISLFDNTIQGLHNNIKPVFSFQGHPEASPGPHDSSKLFDYFIKLIKNYYFKI